MSVTVHFNTRLSIAELASIIRNQLPPKERQELVNLLQADDKPVTKEQLKTDLKEAIEEVNQFKKGKKQLRSAWEVLNEL
ncbi:hypothetical protein EXU85_11685 [Spirosoma sp. KCTC 42546]|uniref:hypothetical protein n=1 Tax=Spirosoma sp. KCTC 42546 TaxID=2520506 RepID=UPI001159AC6D|nr:hypothetical protein [Spirosoma sp. KCTC 42546]QDK79230.1 hypothetical protein EXU85_11685 [Spirosoma sp. KCTC 42546]